MRYTVWDSPTSGKFIVANKVMVGRDAIYFLEESKDWERLVKEISRAEFEKYNELPKGHIKLND
jgi:hypothetical protein